MHGAQPREERFSFNYRCEVNSVQDSKQRYYIIFLCQLFKGVDDVVLFLLLLRLFMRLVVDSWYIFGWFERNDFFSRFLGDEFVFFLFLKVFVDRFGDVESVVDHEVEVRVELLIWITHLL